MAQADLAVVHTLLSAGHYAAACFHGQQAAEKALKAVLYAQGSRVVLGHSVRELARQSHTLPERTSITGGTKRNVQCVAGSVSSRGCRARCECRGCFPPLLRGVGHAKAPCSARHAPKCKLDPSVDWFYGEVLRME
jgi:hypothetical protein